MSELQQDLAELVAKFRRLTVPGAANWDVPGIRYFLDQCVGASPCEVAAAAFALAARPELKTPALLPRPGAHWPKGDHMSGPRVSHNVPCPTHPDQDVPCPTCRDVAERDAISAEDRARLIAETKARVSEGLTRLHGKTPTTKERE